uniref:Uncharacterized protein n=1 Tax=Vespula pensylvanica TaxID=30213 RepID=A0A834KLK6_VESPE|nr:hypothetical protein H0235_014695 [Vespula pensylvanica]
MIPEINLIQVKRISMSEMRLDLANLDLNSKIAQPMDDYERGGFNHGLRNNFGKNQNGTKGDLTFKVIKPAGTVKDLSFVKIITLAHIALEVRYDPIRLNT